MCLNNNKKYASGFTLVELILAMSLFIIILIVAAQSFNQIVSVSAKYVKIEETNIEGVIGLEMLRHDLGQMGYGLPWGWITRNSTNDGLTDSTINYNESTDATAKLLNDNSGANSSATDMKIPRALAGLAGKGAFASDYIALKGTTVGRDQASQRWTYIPFNNTSSATGYSSRPVTQTFNNPLQAGDQVIAINSNYNDSQFHRMLIVDPANNKFYTTSYTPTPDPTALSSYYLPISDQDTVALYGVSGDRMPFNRADYFIRVPGGGADGSLPPFCAPNTGVLYKGVVVNTFGGSGGGYEYMPLLDCVADMKVVLGWDISDNFNGGATIFSSLPTAAGGTPSYIVGGSDPGLASYFTSAEQIRNRLKIMKIYILAQEGRRDSGYQSPATMVVGADPSELGSLPTASNTYTFTTAQRNYHWKVYRIIIRPRNLVSNQK